jgi:hypothetical protein
MALHPSERPNTAEDFRLFLSGQKEIITSPLPQLHQQKQKLSLRDLLAQPAEQALAWFIAGMMVISLITTLGN